MHEPKDRHRLPPGSVSLPCKRSNASPQGRRRQWLPESPFRPEPCAPEPPPRPAGRRTPQLQQPKPAQQDSAERQMSQAPHFKQQKSGWDHDRTRLPTILPPQTAHRPRTPHDQHSPRTLKPHRLCRHRTPQARVTPPQRHLPPADRRDSRKRACGGRPRAHPEHRRPRHPAGVRQTVSRNRRREDEHKPPENEQERPSPVQRERSTSYEANSTTSEMDSPRPRPIPPRRRDSASRTDNAESARSR